MNSCLQVKTNVKKGCLTVDANKVTNNLNIKVSTLDKQLSSFVHTAIFNSTVKANVVLNEKLVGVYCYRVCSITSEQYLIVSPNNLWLSSDVFDSAEFDIISNVVWKID